MPQVKLRPNGVYAGNWETSGGAVETVLSDVNLATWARTADASYLHLNLQDPSLPAGATIESIRVGVIWRGKDVGVPGSSSNEDIWLEGYAFNYYSSTHVLRTFTSDDVTLYTDYGPLLYTKGDSSPWAPSDLNAALLGISASAGYGSQAPYVYEAWLEVNYITHTAPNVPIGLAKTSADTVTTPTFAATVGDPDAGNTIKVRFELYQNDGVTLIGTIDSGYYASGLVASATYGSALAVGQYKVRAQGIDNEGLSSAWTALVPFIVATAVAPKDSTYLWNVADPTTPVSKDSTYLWTVDELKAKQIGLLWNTYMNVSKDLTLLWGVNTPWIEVSEGATATWVEAVEL